ncbi:transferrin receptor-like dimerization domain-containing protein [Sphingomonas sp. 28-63-12]|uniref:transferrin receptor-like dimerization domain-containing protein n=1 Tax=Sphingomonas sp. 28-63-12 TaxID=1970434 RepID=UPI000BD2F959|nr:MAG: folate hydrolase [Sphingomonas sp. 28-63-12]
MARYTVLLAAISGLALATSALAAGPKRGPALEAAFDAQVSAKDQIEWLKRMSAEPNQVGSPHNKANAEATLALFTSWGWDAHIETFQVLYPTPVSTTIEMIAPSAITLGGQEPMIAEDESSGHLANALPPYVAYQGDGDVTADLVYVNYGLPEDYEALERRGISVKGKIVITRYGGGWRGLKPKLAQEHGAIGCLIYSDPAQDGYVAGDPYPKGGTRPATGVQRGSVVDLVVAPGDPLTPGIGATEGATRLTRETAPTILKIPALPISYGDATKLLSQLGGRKAPATFRGALPFTYHLGDDGRVKVHLAVKSDWTLKPLYDVIATLKGAKYPDQWIVRGNHHDGWVFGAQDPLSGNVAMLSEAKALGALLKTGWRPDRTIVYASWDGEEPGLIGSTEWAETHAEELKAKALIYINTDGNGRGFLGALGSHDYQHLVSSVAADVIDPQTGRSVLERLQKSVRAEAFAGGNFPADLLAGAEAGGDLAMGALGSGSDYSAFLQHLGLPSLNIGYGGEDQGDGVYHSIYDSYHHFTTFDDPGLAYGAVLSKTVGRIVLRMADAATPPQRFGDFANAVSGYLAEVKKLASDRRAADDKRIKLVTDGAFGLASDPLDPVAAPPSVTPTPYIELAALDNAVDHLKKSAAAYDAAYAAKGMALSPAARVKLNGLLADIDQLLIDDKGLPGRPWFRNLIYAPGRFTGYGAKTLPGVREAIEERRFADAATYAVRTAAVIDAYATRLDKARGLLD